MNVGVITVAFNKDMDPSTTGDYVYLSIGSTAVNASVEYNSLERQVKVVPARALNANTTYTVNITTNVKALNGTAFTAAVSQTFTTGAGDSTSPSLSFGNADEYSIAITFSEAMNAANSVDSLNFPTSVLNPEVLDVIKYGVAGFATSTTGTAVGITSASEL